MNHKCWPSKLRLLINIQQIETNRASKLQANHHKVIEILIQNFKINTLRLESTSSKSFKFSDSTYSISEFIVSTTGFEISPPLTAGETKDFFLHSSLAFPTKGLVMLPLLELSFFLSDPGILLRSLRAFSDITSSLKVWNKISTRMKNQIQNNKTRSIILNSDYNQVHMPILQGQFFPTIVPSLLPKIMLQTRTVTWVVYLLILILRQFLKCIRLYLQLPFQEIKINGL